MLREELFKEFLKNKNNLEIREELIELHLPLVRGIVKRYYCPRFLTKEDLFQEGVLGLIKALDNYEDKGYDFLAYAKINISAKIQRLLLKSHFPSLIANGTQKVKDFDKNTFQIKFIEIYRNEKPMCPHQMLVEQLKQDVIMKKLKTRLSKNEFKVICLNFGLPFGEMNKDFSIERSNPEIASILNLTVDSVRWIKKEAFKKLRNIYQTNTDNLSATT